LSALAKTERALHDCAAQFACVAWYPLDGSYRFLIGQVFIFSQSAERPER